MICCIRSALKEDYLNCCEFIFASPSTESVIFFPLMKQRFWLGGHDWKCLFSVPDVEWGPKGSFV